MMECEDTLKNLDKIKLLSRELKSKTIKKIICCTIILFFEVQDAFSKFSFYSYSLK